MTLAKPFSSRTPFWLYPNLIGLDAPIVAVVWQGFLAQAFHVSLPLAAQTGLFSAVWLIYVLDRLLDGRHIGPTAMDRHRFAARQGRLLAVLAGLAVVSGLVSAAALPVDYLLAGGLVVGVVVAYLAAVHLFPKGWVRNGAKELLVGVVFALGVGLHLLVTQPTGWWWAAVIGFGLLCWWNCRLIDRWEMQPRAGRTVGRVIGLTAVGLTGLSVWPVLVATGMSAVLLLLVDLTVHRLGVRVARVLADAVLLTPLVVWPFV